MLHKKVFNKFETLFPEDAHNTLCWFPTGKNCIRVRLMSGREFIFTYNSDKDWTYETADAFIKRMKGELTM